ncbi:N-acetyltransferase [bacterium]|nr:MAG: N-acetyltransferase [bacterium]
MALFARKPVSMVREARGKDLSLAWPLIAEHAAELGRPLLGNPELLKRHFSAWKVCGLYVALEGKQVVGYAVATRTYDVFRTLPGIHATHLWVSPSSRDRGHERALLQFLANQGQSHGYAHLLIHPECVPAALAQEIGASPDPAGWKLEW